MKTSFCVLEEKLVKKIKSGIVNHGFMVYDSQERKEDGFFFEYKEEAEDFISEILKTETKKKFILAEVNLNIPN